MRVRFGYAGAHMFDRKSGLNVLLDDMEISRSEWSQAPRYVSIALTNACELSCSYCYASKLPAKLNAAQVRSWARRLDDFGCFGIGFGGGEPTVYPGFASLCRDIHESTGLAITMTTHGHRFSSELVDQMSGNVEFIRLSMDGIGATYERLRGRSFDAFKEKLILVRATARFGINYVVNDDTLGDLPGAAEFAFKSGAEELLLLPEIAATGNVSLSQPSIDRLSAFIQANYQRLRLATSSHGGDCIDAPMLMRSDPTYETFDFAHIDARATLRPSAFSPVGITLKDEDDIVEAIGRLRALSENSELESI